MNYQKIVAGLAFAACLLNATAFAQDAAEPLPENAVGDIAGHYYVSPMFSYTFADTDRRTDDAIGGLLAIGKQVNPYANLEVYGSYNRYGAKHSDDQDGRLLTGGVAVVGFPFSQNLGATGHWLGGAYVLGGVNYAKGSKLPLRNGYFDQNHQGYAFDAGLGYLARIPFVRFASLRFDVRYRLNFTTSPFASVEPDDENNDKPNFGDIVASVGVLVPLGSRPEPPPPPPAPVVVPASPPDSDGDGVIDPIDQCPNTPAGEKVDEHGCPLPPPPPPCKTPEPGQHVDLAGCATGDTIVLRGVNFEFNKANLTPDADSILSEVVSALQARPDIMIELGGHTDSRGSDAYNLKLSDRRANAVMAYLVAHGIDASRLGAKGYGETQPIADNTTDDGRELNRRVELRVTESNTPVTVAQPGRPDEAVPPAVPAGAATAADPLAASAPVQ